MLVLSRKIQERIKIGPDIWITLVDIDRNKVRIGIEAPKDVIVTREELLPEGNVMATTCPRSEVLTITGALQGLLLLLPDEEVATIRVLQDCIENLACRCWVAENKAANRSTSFACGKRFDG